MAENPPLNRLYVLGYAANDRDYPIVSLNADPRVAGYRVPEDLSVCPDKRYPNHVFTGAQPISGDERVRHIWEILPSPWVPFTRYDDDLGPVQGRRRSVKNDGQVAIREANKQVTYEAREGSAIVYTELEETWSIKTDEDGNSLFPIRDRDFYDASRGPVQERRQLFVPTGEEEGSLENVNGVITQTSYEPYNEFLSVKIVQTYKVNGPQLIGKATDNDGQLVTITTQRKGSDGYVPPDPTATRTVEVSREDAESLVERIVDTPEIFKANTFSVERPDPIPQKFRVAVPIKSSQEIVEGEAETPTLEEGEISKSEEQRNKFIKRVSSTSRDQAVLPKTLTGKATNNERQEVTVTETLQLGNTNEKPSATTTIESEALGDGNYVITKTEVDEVFSAKILSKEATDPVPAKFRVAAPTTTTEETVEGNVQDPILQTGEFAKSEQQINKFTKRLRSTFRNLLNLPKTIVQKATNNEGQLVTVRETLQIGDTAERPTATTTVESEAIGDGTYVVRVTEAPRVFKAQTFRAERADLTPQKFRAKQSDLTTEENIEGDASSPTLGENEFLKSEQQINEFVKRVTTNTRTTELNETLNELVITPEGQLATRTVTLAKASQTLSPSATLIDGDVEELGDGRTVKTEVRVEGPFDAKQESMEKPEVIPPEFRASLQNRTISEIRSGQSSAITSLSGEELSKTIQRITEHKIRETTTTRPTSSYPSLKGELVDNDLIKITRTRTVSKGDQNITPSATVSGTVEALGDGYTLKTEDEKAKVFKAEAFSIERPDNIPIEFRVEKPASTEEFNEEGEAKEVSLSGTQIAKSEQQVNAFVKRVRTTTRDDVGNVTLSEEQVDQDGVKVTVERQLSKGTQTIDPSETVRGQVQNLGGGYTVKTTLTRNEVLELPSFSVEKPDVVPAAFRSQVPTTTEEKTIVGDAEEPTLNDEDISKTERQIDKFLKRTTTISRPETVSGKLVGEQIENDGIRSTVTRTLSDGPQQIEPSATVSGNVEEIGDGLTIKTEIVKAKFFEGKSFSQEKPDNIPVEFRAEKPITTEEFTEEGEAKEVSLSGDEISKSEQQITAFLKRTRTTTRDIVGGVTLEGEQIDQDGIKVTVTRTLQGGTQLITPSAKTSGQVEAIGDGKTIKTELEKAEVFDAKTLTRQQAFQLPAKFITEKTEEESFVEEATNAEPEELGNNGTGIVQSTAQRVTAFTVRKNTRTINGVNSLTEKQLSNSGQEITIESSISDDPTIETGPTVEIARTQAIGGGKFLKEIGKVADVFDAQQESRSQSIQVPPKFFTEEAVETSTIVKDFQATPEGLGNDGFGVTRSSAQRVNAFTVRKIKTEQAGVTELSEQQLNNFGQVVNVKSVITEDPTVEGDEKTEFSRAQAIGGGKYLKETGTVDEFWNPVVFSQERPDITPEKFKALLPLITTEKTETGPAVLEDTNLNIGDLSKSSQKITEFTKRIRESKRENKNGFLVSTQFTTELGGGIAKVYETYGENLFSGTNQGNIIFGTVSDVTENLGNGKTVRRRVILDPASSGQAIDSELFTTKPTLSILKGQEYDESLDIVIPYTQFFAQPESEEAKGERRRTTPRDAAHTQVTKYDIKDVQEKLEEYFWVISDMVEISLPPKLISVSISGSGTKASTNTNSVGDTYLLQKREVDSVDGDLNYQIEEGFRGVIPASRAIFFLPKEFSDPSSLLAKVNEKSTEEISYWPNVRTKGYQITLTAESETRETSDSVSFDSSSTSTSTSKTVSTRTSTIPPTLHGEITIENFETEGGTVKPSPNNLSATGKDGKFPVGKYIYRISCTPYRFSYTRVEALIVDITEQYV